MKLYIDESGNTGETLSSNLKFNFTEQPYYVLAGVIIPNDKEEEFEKLIISSKDKYKIQGDELKAKSLYVKKDLFIKELVDYIEKNKLPVFIELMDKQYYLNIQIIEYFILPYYSLPLTDETLQQKRIMAGELSDFLSPEIYEAFIETTKIYTNNSLEIFYDKLIAHFDTMNKGDFKSNIEMTKSDYFEKKAKNQTNALKMFLPIPDENPRNRLIHLLPNYNAFSNLIGRIQKYIDDNSIESIKVLHDEQKQFDIIYKKAFNLMKENDYEEQFKNTFIKQKGNFKIDDKIQVEFVNSKNYIFVQVADLLAGITMRFWNDFKQGNSDKIDKYSSIIDKIKYPVQGNTQGINFVVPTKDRFNYFKK